MNGLIPSIKVTFKLLAEHWALVTGLSLVYLYYISLNSSYLYYREFGIDTFLYFDLVDYPRILMADNKILLQPMMAFALVFLALTFADIKSSEGEGTDNAKVFSVLSIVAWIAFGFVVLFLPGFHSWSIAKNTYDKSSVTVRLTTKSFHNVSAIGSTTNYLFLSSRSKMISMVIPKNEIREIIHNKRMQPAGE